MDVNIFTALIGACKSKETHQYVDRIETHSQFGCGRQALRMFDVTHHHMSSALRSKAAAIMELSCPNVNRLAGYIGNFRLHRQQCGPNDIDDAMALELVKTAEGRPGGGGDVRQLRRGQPFWTGLP